MVHLPDHKRPDVIQRGLGRVARAIVPGEREDQDRRACDAKGGIWNSTTKVCELPPPPAPPAKSSVPGVPDLPKPTPAQSPTVNPSVPEFIREDLGKGKKGKITGVTLANGQTFFGSEEEVRALASKRVAQAAIPVGTQEAGTTQRGADVAFQQAQLAAEGQALAGQVGQIDPSTGITPTDLSEKEALIVGVRDAIPRALSLAGGAFVLGGTVGLAAGGTASIPLAIGGAAATFVGSISSSMISNMRSQRVDNTNAQQRVLDEGKQTLNDWVTLAGADPAKRTFYLSQFNIQLQLIQDAHVQMLTDTEADFSKYENAIPNLAEFNSFYNEGGERDALVQDMIVSLTTPATPEYAMIELAQRRKRD